MRGNDGKQNALFSYVDLEARVPANHPLRRMRGMVDEILRSLDKDFEEMYAQSGRPGIPPERLLRALMIQVLYSVRSERMLMEQLDYNLLFRWFVGLGMDDSVWDASTFSKNRDRLLEQEISKRFLQEVVMKAREGKLLSDEHFTVDGTFIEAWASHKSFKKKDKSDDPPQGGRNASVNFQGEKRTNQTHESTTDPEARLMRKGGDGAKLVHHGHVMTENRNGLVVSAEVSLATGRSEVETAVKMIESREIQKTGTVGADKAYDHREFIQKAREAGLTPHVAQNISKTHSSYIDERTTRHWGYGVSQRRRKLVEEFFGWMKTVGLLRKTRHRGTRLVGWMFEFAAAMYNLVRMRSLLASG